VKALATQSDRVALWGGRKVKLWEEPDRMLVTDDVRGGCHSFWAGWHYAAACTQHVPNPEDSSGELQSQL
jgi:hypothetical protein